MHASHENHLITMKRILHFLVGTLDYGLVFSASKDGLSVHAFSNVGWGGDASDRRTLSAEVAKGASLETRFTRVNAELDATCGRSIPGDAPSLGITDSDTTLGRRRRGSWGILDEHLRHLRQPNQQYPVKAHPWGCAFHTENIRISVIGDLAKLPEALQELILNLEETTKNNSHFQLIIAVSYSGKYDIIQACQRLALKAKHGLIEPSDIDISLMEQELQTNCTEFSRPDLLIRTSGEFRISNFMLWQLAYTELFFAQSLWPDFGEAEFLKALLSFQQRQRRYGG
ncbi:Dehydrodolichyl diphosphate synthase 5 [Hibiscus syriacus]|uniref:Alkyl transferase n=1 Tax=Hibiscus syriacus TaxID=106335 RepID=A0A6A3A243_HIBSY|nr:Dehydrodolichyl diphosphate synthase 5 [Hibiscus syriacus]